MVEVFKTNVQNHAQAKPILAMLREVFTDAQINFDLADRDKILRVAGIQEKFTPVIIADLHNLGFHCEILE